MTQDLTWKDGALLAILAIAAGLRLGVACWPVIHHPDELWQYLEPAHRIVAGRWVETWDFRDGVRSWFLPMLLAGPMALGEAVAPRSWLDILLARLLCAAVSTAAVLACAGLGARLSRLHALVAAFVAATWFEFAYFGGRTSAEPVASGLALVAAWLLLGASARRAAAAGLLLGIACAIRIQYAPALAVLALGMTGRDGRRSLALVAGGLCGLAFSAAADLAMGATPVAWIVRNFTINLAEGKAAGFGVEPFWWYGLALWQIYGLAVAPLVGLAIVGSRRYPVLLASALCNLLVHSLIAHKEYRFILLTTMLLVVLAAIGSADLVERYGRRGGRGPALALGSLWLLLSGSCAAFGISASDWGTHGRLISQWKVASEVPGLCGMAVYRTRDVLVASQALLHRDVPIYQYDGPHRAAGMASRAFNVALSPAHHGGELPGFERLSCEKLGDFCIFHRSGGCAPIARDRGYEENLFLAQRGR